MSKPFLDILKLPSETVLDPNTELDRRFPGLSEKYCPAFKAVIVERKIGTEKTKVWLPIAINERFFAALLTSEGHPQSPAVFDAEQAQWYLYEQVQGVYRVVLEQVLHEKISSILTEVAAVCEKENGDNVDVTPLQFEYCKNRVLAPVTTKARGLAAVNGDFWDRPELAIPCKNGVFCLERDELVPLSPDWHFQALIDAEYHAEADCPKWEKFVARSLPNDDRLLLQKIFGMLLVGKNIWQIMFLMTGAAGSGKGVICRVMASLVGKANTVTLRSDRLLERFEIGRLVNKALLYAPDVGENFLNVDGAHLLKSITGEDGFSPEYKHSNAVPPARPIHGLPVITANSRLRVRFEGDKEAWRRRLVFIHFDSSVPDAERVEGLSESLFRDEGSGILNWAIDGIRLMLRDNFKLILTDAQKKRRDGLLNESESYTAFAKEAVEPDEVLDLLDDDAYTSYVDFCTERGWAPVTPRVFGIGFKQAVVDLYGVTQSHSLRTALGKSARGWRRLKLVSRRKRHANQVDSDTR